MSLAERCHISGDRSSINCPRSIMNDIVVTCVPLARIHNVNYFVVTLQRSVHVEIIPGNNTSYRLRNHSNLVSIVYHFYFVEAIYLWMPYHSAILSVS